MKKRIYLAAFLMSLFAVFTAQAQTRAITGLTISATHTIEPGDILSTIEIDYDHGTEGKVNLSVSTSDCVIDSAKLTGSGTRYVNVGDKITVTAVISPVDPDERAFTGTYSKSNIKISGGGAFESCSLKNGSLTVKFTLKPVSGLLNAPENPSWKGSAKAGTTSSDKKADGTSTKVTHVTGPGSHEEVVDEETPSKTDSKTSSSGPGSTQSSGTSAGTAASSQNSNLGKATWTAPSGTTGYYEVWLYKGSTVIHKFTEVKGTNVDCYPYMTKKGSYYFKVRTVPVTTAEKKYAKASEWAISDEYYLDEEHVSDGTGADVSAMKNAGWNKSGSYWYYKYPDGTIKKNGWEKVNDKWYLFDAEGRMLTGKQETKSGVYYLAAEGDMQTGWIKIDKEWYYFNPDKTSATEGAMLREAWVNEAGTAYYLTKTGVMATGWVQIGENWYHFDESGCLSRNTTIDTFYVNEDGIWVK